MTAPVVSALHRYDGVALSLHWLSAALALTLITTGLIMTRLGAGSAGQFALYQLHKELGVTLLLLTALRAAWRAMRPPPPWPPEVPHARRTGARLVHAALYLGLLAVPIAGWALVSASAFNIPTSLFGFATWPHLPVLSDLDAASRARIEPVLSRVHAILAYGLATLVLLHSAAAIWHGRSVLVRMVPRWPSRAGEP
jgi:cytochrome b561